MDACSLRNHCHASPSSRRAWIEITMQKCGLERRPVALLAEGVDRNIVFNISTLPTTTVALLAEGVDRNFSDGQRDPEYCVALLAEGVDRNQFFQRIRFGVKKVALLAEGVDRNFSLA